jgi:hypothetical protein
VDAQFGEAVIVTHDDDPLPDGLIVAATLVVVGALIEMLAVEDDVDELLDGVAVADATPQEVVLLPGPLAQTQTALAEARTASALPIPQAPITQFAAVAWIAAD